MMSTPNTLSELWDERFAEPVFALTADQDWAPEWVMERFLAYVREAGLPLHMFVTNRSPAVERACREPGMTLGAHPSFIPGTSHGSTPEEVIATCRSLVPDARTFRSHAYAEDAHILSLLRHAGFETDSNLSLFLQPRIVPLIHANGILRLPVFLDDDSLLLWDGTGDLELQPMSKALATPGLKILNFHPTLFALNTPSVGHYRANKERLYGQPAEELAPFEGRGLADVLRELVDRIRDGRHELKPFEEIVEASWHDLRSLDDAALYAWGPASEPSGHGAG